MSNPLRLLREITPISEFKVYSEIIEEADGQKRKSIRFKGPFISCEKENKNGRLYPKEVVIPAVEIYNKERILTKSSFGQLDHPENVDLSLVLSSHIVESMAWRENDVEGIGRCLPYLPNGRMLEGLLADKVNIGVSSRGLGSLQENSDGVKNVNEFSIIAVDCVANPSGVGCIIESINENISYIIEGSGNDKKFIRVEPKRACGGGKCKCKEMEEKIEIAHADMKKSLQSLPKKDTNQYLWENVLKPFFDAVKGK